MLCQLSYARVGTAILARLRAALGAPTGMQALEVSGADGRTGEARAS
jgi:hypothetical protein